MALHIGLDYDGTITNAPDVFFAFAKSMKDAGHKVYIVTMRYPSECGDIPEKWYKITEGIVPTSRQAKDRHMKALGITIHIWVDDNPKAVHMSATEIWGQASPEGAIVDPMHAVN